MRAWRSAFAFGRPCGLRADAARHSLPRHASLPANRHASFPANSTDSSAATDGGFSDPVAPCWPGGRLRRRRCVCRRLVKRWRCQPCGLRHIAAAGALRSGRTDQARRQRPPAATRAREDGAPHCRAAHLLLPAVGLAAAAADTAARRALLLTRATGRAGRQRAGACWARRHQVGAVGLHALRPLRRAALQGARRPDQPGARAYAMPALERPSACACGRLAQAVTSCGCRVTCLPPAASSAQS
jgi:hypothetical protein